MTPDDLPPYRSQRSGLVTLMTDFGTLDSYVGQMKGVLFSRAPDLRAVIDLTHGIPAQDVGVAAFQLAHAWRYFPKGTVHVAVVDPGVGTERGILALERDGHCFLAPDNGLLAPLIEPQARLVALDIQRLALPSPSATFHGRDVFAPAAARLVQGEDLERLGPRIAAASSAPPAWCAGAGVGGDLESARILFSDRFGNLITDLQGDVLGPSPGDFEVGWGGRWLPILRTYGEVSPGQPLALINSFGVLEIAVRDGDAARSLGLLVGQRIQVRRSGLSRSAPPTPRA